MAKPVKLKSSALFDLKWCPCFAAFIHVNFQHMLANMLLLMVVGGLLEKQYGTIRITIVLVLSTLGAAFFSGAFEDRCTQVCCFTYVFPNS